MYLLSLPAEFAEYLERNKDIDLTIPTDRQSLEEMLCTFFEAGGERVLMSVSDELETSFGVKEFDSFREEFYEAYNLQFIGRERDDIVLILGNQKWDAKWCEEHNGPIGCFWGHQYSVLNEKGEWAGQGGGPLEGNPQTDKEVRQALLKLASNY